MKKNCVSKIEKALCFLLAICFFYHSAVAQSVTVVRGIVADDKGAPLAGVTVSVKGAKNKTTSDVQGKFSISVPRNGVLVFTHVGMTTVEKQVTGTSALTITMESSSVNMNEIVVIGYGTVRKKDLTGSVSSVKSEDIQKTALTSFQQGIKGRLAGVEVVQGDATPGGSSYIQIRGVSTMLGTTEPLYVVDGVPMNVTTSGGTTSAAGFSNTNPLATIPPSDIESVEVLKDASATAIYGSLGANGVVMITTKKGKVGNTKVTFNTTQSVSVLSKKIQVLNARQYAEYKNENYANSYPYNPVTNWDFPLGNTDSTKLSPEQLEALVGKGIDWQDEIYRPAPVQDYQMTFSGGTSTTTYAVMLNYLNQKGILRNSGFNRGGLRFNLDQRLNSSIKLVTTASFSRSTNRLVKTSTNDGSALSGGVVRKALTYSPIPPIVKDPVTGKIIGISTGDPTSYDTDDPSYQNNWGATPLRYLEEAKVRQALTTITGSVGLQIQLAKGLSFRPRIGGTFYQQRNDNYFPRTLNEGRSVNGLAQVAYKEFNYLTSENLLSYQFAFRKHRFDLLGGFTYEQSANRYNKMEASGFANDNIGYWDLASATLTTPSSSAAAEWKLMSFFGRANYTLNDKYLFTYTYRRDGSSKFAPGNKYASFQSGAFAWKVDQESFVKRLQWISTLKLRTSYGESGNQGLQPYQSLSIMQAGTGVIGNTLVNSFSEVSQANPNLKWETTNQINIGLDLGVFDNRLSASVNWYDKLTHDLLQSVTAPPSSGYTTKTVNSGKIRNRGIELEVAGQPVRSKNFLWNINANLSHNKNTILALGGGLNQQFAPSLGGAYGLNVQPFIQRVGESIGAIYGYVVDGIFQNQAEVNTYFNAKGQLIDGGSFPAAVGVYRFKDLNDDGVIDANDQQIIGHTIPDYMWGCSNTFTYKAFDLGIFVSGVWGNDIINSNIMMPSKLNAEGNIPVWLYKDAWRGENTSTTQRQIKTTNNEPKRFISQYLSDGTYTRISNIQLGYTFNVRKIKGITALRTAINAINPFTFTRYQGYDPEVSANSSALTRGVDLGSYPQAKTYSFNINITF